MNNFQKLCKIVGANPRLAQLDMDNQEHPQYRSPHWYMLKIAQGLEPRSIEYLEGWLMLVNFKMGLSNNIKCPYGLGSVQADAFYGGVDYGHTVWTELNQHQDALNQGKNHEQRSIRHSF